jgi:hypothetical protein
LLEKVDDVDKAFSKGGKLYDFVKDQSCLYFNQGLVEALSIQLPEKFDREIYEVLEHLHDDPELIIAVINSLVWRDSRSINPEKLNGYITRNVFRYQNTFSHFFETMISLSPLENHPYNAERLHSFLIKQSLPNRDATWSSELKYKHEEESTFRHLIDWAWSKSDKSHISDYSIELSSTTLCWFLTSTNRKLRDCTTKSIVNLLENRIHVLIAILEKFKDVDDPYVSERLYAVALGCTLRTKQTETLGQLAECVYNLVFSKDEVYPHALLRDYAREIIEYVAFLGDPLENIDIRRTNPPYQSVWPTNIPTKDELTKQYNKDTHTHIWRSVMGFGDFSRYTIGTNSHHSDWSGVMFGGTPVQRECLYNDFKIDLSEEQLLLHDALDPIISRESDEKISMGDTELSLSTAIGMKSKEELDQNREAFKGSLKEDQLSLYESEIEPFLDRNRKLIDTDKNFDLRVAQRFIFNRVIELGWTSELHLEFDKEIGTGRGRHEPHQERIGKKYQWIAYHEFIASLADNFIRYEGYSDDQTEKLYLGPWDPYIRDIDPTILLKETGSQGENDHFWWRSSEVFDWDCSFEDWVSDETTVKNPLKLIELTDPDGIAWLVLESYQFWKEPKIMGSEEWGYPRKELWCKVKSYLVKNEEFEKFSNWIETQHFMDMWMPDSTDRYQLFNREYYWSQAFSCFETEYYGGSAWSEVHDQETKEYIAKVSVNSINYHWEEEFDRSKNETLHFLKPSASLVKYLNLEYGDTEGTFVNSHGEVICFAAEAIHNSPPHLLVRKDEFLAMLEENNLMAAWTLLGSKGVIGGAMSSNKYYGEVEFSGSFSVEGGEVVGHHRALPRSND